MQFEQIFSIWDPQKLFDITWSPSNSDEFLPYVLKYDINVEAVFIHPEYHQQNNEVAKNDMYWDISLTVSFSFAENEKICIILLELLCHQYKNCLCKVFYGNVIILLTEIVSILSKNKK